MAKLFKFTFMIGYVRSNTVLVAADDATEASSILRKSPEVRAGLEIEEGLDDSLIPEEVPLETGILVWLSSRD